MDPGDCSGKGVRSRGELHQQRVVERQDLRAHIGRTLVEADPGASRSAIGRYLAAGRPKVVRRILGRDPALQREAAPGDRLLPQAQFVERVPARDEQLRADQVDIGGLLGHGVLDLDPRIHLDEHVTALTIDEELHRPGVDVSDLAREPHGIREERFPYPRVEIWRRSQLDQLLVPALDGAVALEQMHDLTLLVSEHLDLDVPRTQDGLLQIDRSISERPLSLSHGSRCRFLQNVRVFDEPHAATAAARDRLDEQREAKPAGRRCHRSDVRQDLGGGENWQTRPPCGFARPDLVAGDGQHIGRRTDERDSGGGALSGKLGVLRHEPVSGIDGISADPPREIDHQADVEIRPHRMTRLPEFMRLIRLQSMSRVAILGSVDRSGRHAQLIGGTESANRDLAAIRDEELVKHAH